MNVPQPLTPDVPVNDPANDKAAQHEADDAYYRTTLHGALDGAAELTRLIVQQARHSAEAANAAVPPATKPSTIPEFAEAYDRVVRNMRSTVTLARSLRLPPAASRASSARRYAPATPAQRIAARKRILRDVEDSIIRGALEPSEATQLQSELEDRLASPDLEDEIGTRPTTEIIADICRDLGLGAQSGIRKWKRRTPQDIEALRTRATAPLLPLPSGEGRGEGLAPPPDPGGIILPYQPRPQ